MGLKLSKTFAVEYCDFRRITLRYGDFRSGNHCLLVVFFWTE